MQKSVLIVEDDEMSLKLISHILEAVGFTWAAARDGHTALDMAASLKPDVILLDIQLPGVSGLEVAKLIKADAGLRHIPIIAVTAFAMVGDKDKILTAGCDEYVSKPIEVKDLVFKIKRALDAPAPGSETDAPV